MIVRRPPYSVSLKKGRYTNEQIFNVDGTGLFCKCMPFSTFASQEEKKMPDHNAPKARPTLLLGVNCGR
jgi:hypothetical protein